MSKISIEIINSAEESREFEPILWAIHRESRYNKYDISEAKVEKFFRNHIADNDKCFIAARLEGQIIGTLFGIINETFFSDDRVGMVTFFYVYKKYRMTAAAPKMLYVFQEWAKKRKAQEIMVGVTTNVRIKETDRFLQRIGFDFIGGNYSKSLK